LVTAKKYKKKPVTIEAFRFHVDHMPDWFKEAKAKGDVIISIDHCKILTPEGVMIGWMGDYIIKGIAGELYPCKETIFLESYEEVDEDNGDNW
jgi:hypothetical protein